MDLLCDPPKPGEESYERFRQESSAIMASLSRKAAMITTTFNSMVDCSCSPVDGSLFAFPRIRFTAKALEAAKAAGLSPDTFYATCLLDRTGVCVSSGNIFGQKEGIYHIRLTLMPPEEKVSLALARWKQFHDEFQQKYAD